MSAPTEEELPRDAPVIGIACGVDEQNVRTRRSYARCVATAGGLPILLPPPEDADEVRAMATRFVALCDGVILTGGSDPATERWGHETHARAVVEPPVRQRFDEALLSALDDAPGVGVLGVCLGMQMMALHRGGRLEQHMPDSVPTHLGHMDDSVHEIVPEARVTILGSGSVTSWHRQCVIDPGALSVAARAPDGVIEAVVDPARRFYLGVQWHPERTDDACLGMDVFRRLVVETKGPTS